MAKRKMQRKDESAQDESILEGMHFEILQQWIANGRTETMPNEMAEYLDQLDHIRGLWNTNHTETQIIRHLKDRYGLNRIQAKSRWNDALTYFFMDKDVKQQVWRNMLFQKLYDIGIATIQSATDPKHYEMASRIFLRAYQVKGLDQTEEEALDEAAYKKRNVIYTLKPEDVSLPSADRNILAEYIDNMDINELEKSKIKQDAGIEPRKLFINYDTEEEN